MIKRIIIKLSGELFSDEGNKFLINSLIKSLIKDIIQLVDIGIEIGIVVGGGNIVRGGFMNFNKNISRITFDYMGMLATMINSLALTDILSSYGIKTRVLSSKRIDGILNVSDQVLIKEFFSKKYVIVFAGGTGNAFVTTDTAASLRAVEIDADIICKATTVNGIYDKDPNKYNDAIVMKDLTFEEVLKNKFEVMDLSAFIQCRDFNIPICVFNMNKKGALIRIINREPEGTWVRN